jgi:4-amino-4-deoxychorismate lyase
VFDTCNVIDGKAYGLCFHLDRLIKSAGLARISLPYSKEEMRRIVLATIAVTQRREGIFVRFWLAAGAYTCASLACGFHRPRVVKPSFPSPQGVGTSG